MEILVFLIGLGYLVLLVWGIALFGSLISGWKYRQRKLSIKEIPKQRTSQTPSVTPVQTQDLAVLNPPFSTRVRLPSNKHQQNIRRAELVLKPIARLLNCRSITESAQYLTQNESLRFREIIANLLQELKLGDKVEAKLTLNSCL